MPVVYLGMIGDIIHPGITNIVNEASKYGKSSLASSPIRPSQYINAYPT